MLTWLIAIATAVFVVPILKWGTDRLRDRWLESRPAASFVVTERGVKDPAAWASPEVLELQAGEWEPPASAVVLALPGEETFSWSFVVNLRSNLRREAAVSAIRAEVVRSDAAPAGTFYFVAPQGDSRRGQIGFDLASTDLEGRSIEGKKVSLKHYLSDNMVTIEPLKSVGFEIMVSAPMDSDIEFLIRIEFDRGKPVIISDDMGSPFRITTYPNSPERAYTFTKLSEQGEFGVYSCRWPDGCRQSMLNVRVD